MQIAQPLTLIVAFLKELRLCQSDRVSELCKHIESDAEDLLL